MNHPSTGNSDLDDRAAGKVAAQDRIEESIAAARVQGWRGGMTLFKKEIMRFANIAGQTVVSPVVTTMLYFLVFGYSLGDRLKEIDGIPYVDFLVPGLVLLALVNNAFINSAFSLFISKIHGTLVDILVTPLSYSQLIFGYTAASVVRAVLIGGIIWGVAIAMGASVARNPLAMIVYMSAVSLAFALLGLVIAILASDFDHINLLPNFLITPLTFLGGVFYSIEMLPEPWDDVSKFNPILYMVNGLRHAMTGVSDVDPIGGWLVVGTMVGICGGLALWLFKSGKRLRE